MTTSAWRDTSIIDQPQLTERGVRVRLVSWQRAQAAALRLRMLGYQVEIDSRSVQREFGEALLVTGWNVSALRARLDRVAEWLGDLEAAHGDLAEKALGAYRFWIDEVSFTEEDARLRVRRDFGRDAAVHVPLVQRMCPPVSEDEIAQSPDDVRELLLAIECRQRAVRGLFEDYCDTVDGVIQMFREYRDRHGVTDLDRAAALARTEVAESCAARYDVAEADITAALANREEA